MPLDIDVLTSTGTQKIVLTEKGVKVVSDFTPVVDSKGYYLKTVTSD